VHDPGYLSMPQPGMNNRMLYSPRYEGFGGMAYASIDRTNVHIRNVTNLRSIRTETEPNDFEFLACWLAVPRSAPVLQEDGRSLLLLR
jgi:hypothetical protein